MKSKCEKLDPGLLSIVQVRRYDVEAVVTSNGDYKSMNRTLPLIIAGSLPFMGLAANKVTAAEAAGVLAKGRTHFVVTGGSGQAFNDDYLVIGVGGNYFVTDGLSLGLNVESWTSGDPGITKVTTSAQYTFFQAAIKPYVGAFYRRAFIEDWDDLDSYGGKAGLYFSGGGDLYLSAGVVYETYSQCEERLYEDCSSTYPEFGVTMAF